MISFTFFTLLVHVVVVAYALYSIYHILATYQVYSETCRHPVSLFFISHSLSLCSFYAGHFVLRVSSETLFRPSHFRESAFSSNFLIRSLIIPVPKTFSDWACTMFQCLVIWTCFNLATFWGFVWISDLENDRTCKWQEFALGIRDDSAIKIVLTVSLAVTLIYCFCIMFMLHEVFKNQKEVLSFGDQVYNVILPDPWKSLYHRYPSFEIFLDSVGVRQSPRPCSAFNTTEVSDHAQVCTICLENVDSVSGSKTFKCKHSFHPECINPWLSQKYNIFIRSIRESFYGNHMRDHVSDCEKCLNQIRCPNCNQRLLCLQVWSNARRLKHSTRMFDNLVFYTHTVLKGSFTWNLSEFPLSRLPIHSLSTESNVIW